MAKIADYIGIYTEEEKEEKRKQSEAKLTELLKDIPAADCAELPLYVPEIAFCEVQAEELREIIGKEGPIARYNHGGGQSGMIKSPVVTTYVSLMGVYMKLLRQFNQALKKVQMEGKTGETNKLLAFIAGGRGIGDEQASEN